MIILIYVISFVTDIFDTIIMHFVHTYGIVLYRNAQNPHRMRVFDHQCGPIDVSIMGTIPPLGALIQYTKEKKQVVYVVRNQHVLRLPSFAHVDDVFFFHHVLEICYYFVPLFHCEQEVLSLVGILYKKDSSVWKTTYGKAIFLCKLLSIIGVHPVSPDESYYTIASCVQRYSLEQLLQAAISHEITHDLAQWIFICLHAHPDISKFKTMKFFKESILP